MTNEQAAGYLFTVPYIKRKQLSVALRICRIDYLTRAGLRTACANAWLYGMYHRGKMSGDSADKEERNTLYPFRGW